MARFFRFVFTLVFISLITGALALGWALLMARHAGPLGTPKTVLIAPRTGTTDMAGLLQREGVINHRYIFILTVILKGDLGELQAGEYEFPARINVFGVVDKIARGDVVQHMFTVPEGLTSHEIIALLQQVPDLTGDVPQPVPADGTLLPETYAYIRGTTRVALIERMQKHMTDTVAELWAKRPADFKLKTPLELVTLASIVEKETGIAAERPMVASVFHNRLNLGMKLQSDPTVIYALTHGTGPLGRALTIKDLEKTASPYNTYMYATLPPGPIANPGRASLAAVISPAQTNNLYFVANGSGGHAFAATLGEHNANVARWRALQKEQEKAP